MLPRIACPAVAVVLLAAGPAAALMVAFRAPAQRAITADVVVVGTVTAVDKDAIEVAPARGAPGKVVFKLAVVKVDQPLAGADALTHLKVGFVPRPPAPGGLGGPGAGPAVLPRRGGSPELKVGDQFVFFLSRHHEGTFYTMPFTSPPIDPKSETGKTELEEAKKALAVVADPNKSLAAAKADDRAFAAAVLVTKYRTFPESGGEVAEVPLPADESRSILKGLAEGDWKQGNRFNAVSPFTAFNQLGLTPRDGWTPPQPPRPVPGQPPADYAALSKEAFVKWLDGPGKDYRVKRVVAKK